MARGSKDKYTDTQKHKAQHIEHAYEDKGVPENQAKERAWATVNKQSGGGDKPGGSGAATSSERKHEAQSDSAKRAAKTRQRHSRTTSSSLESQTKASLMVEARSRNIAGRSTMTKPELVEALKN